ncbi:MAG: TraB/GumN family protein [Clostridia bacterium]|nr:TraB/GumN family protein [Clostridia bacterium]
MNGWRHDKKRLFSGLMTAARLLPPYAEEAKSAPLVYRVTDRAGRGLYLLGTIHAGRPDMYPLGGAVEEAYRNAGILAVELDLDARGRLPGASLMYGPEDGIQNHLSPETCALGVESFGVPEAALRRMKPAMWYSLAENQIILKAGLDAAAGVDCRLMKQARQDGKRIDELETVEGQLAALLAIPEDVIDCEVRAMLTCPEESAKGMRALFEAWRQGDKAALLSLLEESEDGGDGLSDVLIDSRNDGFEEQALQYLHSGETALIAVGAFHIIGKNGLAEKLARRGFTVEEIGRE